MPDRWPAEALKAQAVVARSYALAAPEQDGDFDLYPDTRSQVYGGIAAESPPRPRAVNATAGQVVLYDGELAHDVLLLELGRPDAPSPGRLAGSSGAAVPRLGARPLRLALALPRLGPARGSRATLLGRKLGARGQSARRAHERGRVGTRVAR